MLVARDLAGLSEREEPAVKTQLERFAKLQPHEANARERTANRQNRKLKLISHNE